MNNNNLLERNNTRIKVNSEIFEYIDQAYFYKLINRIIRNKIKKSEKCRPPSYRTKTVLKQFFKES